MPLDAISRHHYENLASGKELRRNGSVSTVFTIQVDDGFDRPTLIPTIWDGEQLSDEDATKRALESGIEWPSADTHDELRDFDIRIHEEHMSSPISKEAAQAVLNREDHGVRLEEANKRGLLDNRRKSLYEEWKRRQ